MGADATWVCHTCKTVCCRGGEPSLIATSERMALQEIVRLKNDLATLSNILRLRDKDAVMSFLDDLHRWLGIHFGHKLHIGSDYSTDIMDLDDYHNEIMDGKISSLTRAEARQKGVEEWEQTRRKEIGYIIRKHKDEIAHGNTGTVANELYQKFSTRDI